MIKPFTRYKLEGEILEFVRSFYRDIRRNPDVDNPEARNEILHGEFTYYRNADMAEGEYVKQLPPLCKEEIEREGWTKLHSDVEIQGIYNFTKTGDRIAPFIYDATLLLENKMIVTQRLFKEARPMVVFTGFCRNIAQFRYLTRELLNIK
jgi:hypothetical protein